MRSPPGISAQARTRGFYGSVFVLLALAIGAACGPWACRRGSSVSPEIEAAPPSPPAPAFADVTAQAGLAYEHGYFVIDNDLILMAGGAAAGDYDNDGWVDLYVIRGDIGPNLLFRNLGDGTFEEVGAEAGVDLYFARGCGPIFADLNGDGWLDLFVGGVDATMPSVFQNNGDGTFSNITTTCGIEIANQNGTFSAAAADYDRDGDVDLCLSHWGADHSDGSLPQHLWRNEGYGTFTWVEQDGWLEGPIDYTFTPNFADIDDDGWLDLLIAADFGTTCVLHNNGDGTYSNVTSPVITDENGMGSTVADYDNDGDLDWFVSSIYNTVPEPNGWWGVSGNRLYRNLGDGSFEDATTEAGVREGAWGWGSTFADLDNDGHLDVVHVNGFSFPHVIGNLIPEYVNDPTRVFMAQGDGTFLERALDLGIDDDGQGRGITAFDYDRDGDLDLLITNNSAPARLFRNDMGNQRNWIGVKLQGAGGNTEAIGARIHVTTGATTQMRELRCGNNFISQDPTEAHFGIGTAAAIDEIRIDWPDGATIALFDVAPNQFLVIGHPETP